MRLTPRRKGVHGERPWRDDWLEKLQLGDHPIASTMFPVHPFTVTAMDDTAMYRAVTRDIEITVLPRFLPEQSSVDKREYFWAYTIEISNRGSATVQLKTRHWRITDAFGRQQEVRGAGVVGEEPVLEPGASFEYTSGVPLPTPSGFMVGTYGMVTATGEHFVVDIPAFSLDSPDTKRTVN